MTLPEYSWTLTTPTPTASALPTDATDAAALGRDLALDVDGDLRVENGDLVLIDGIDAIRQEVGVRLQWFAGEWFIDEERGIPYFEQVLTKVDRIETIGGIFRKAILETPGIVSVDDMRLDFDRPARRLRVDWTATADVGLVSGSTSVAVA